MGRALAAIACTLSLLVWAHTALADAPRTVTDAAGRTVTVPAVGSGMA